MSTAPLIAEPARLRNRAIGIGRTTCHSDRKKVRRDRLHRQFASLCCVITALSATTAALPAESEACREIRVRFETIKPQISAIEVSLTLFSAVDKNCLDLVTELLDHGASV